MSPYTSPTGSYAGGGQPAQPRAAAVSRRARRAKRAAPKPVGPPSVNEYLLGDPVYKNTKAALDQNLGLFKTQNTTNKGTYEADYKTTIDRLAEDEAKAGKNLSADYAARGLMGSGLYGRENTDLGVSYNKQEEDAGLSQQRNLTQLMADLSSAETLNAQKLKDARTQAIRRRAEQYGISV